MLNVFMLIVVAHAKIPMGGAGGRNLERWIRLFHFHFGIGTETLVALIPSVINTTKNTMARYQPDKRKCYEDAEFDLPNLRYDDGYRYSHTNCLYQGPML